MTGGRNVKLALLMREARFSNKSLARAVRQVSAGHSEPVACDHTSVSRWLAGGTPRPLTRGFIAEALAGRVGRAVGLADIGMPGVDVLPPLAAPQMVRVQMLADLAALTAEVQRLAALVSQSGVLTLEAVR